MFDKSPQDKPSQKDTDVRIHVGRSPAYPYISLEKAVERADQIRAAGATRAALPPETFYKVWQLGSQSSGSRQIMAALNHFGLVDYIGRGDDRKVKLSDLALRIVLDKQPDSNERAAALKEAALTPPIHKELFERFGFLLPPDAVVETFLCRDSGYSEQAALSLLDEYKATLEFSGLDQPANMPSQTEGAPMYATALIPEPGGVTPNPTRAQEVATSKHGMQSLVGLADDEKEMLHGPLSRAVSYRLVVRGEAGPKEIGKLIKILELQKSLLEDDDDAD